MTGLFEDEKRRDDYVEGRGIRLENGEVWQVPLPRVEYRLSIGNGRSRNIPAKDTNRRFSANFFDRQSDLREKIQELQENVNPQHVEFAELVLPLAADLLRRNYDLTNDEITDLLLVIENDPTNVQMWLDLADVALANGPKA